MIDQEVDNLADQNTDLKNSIKRYKDIIANFDEEFKAMKKYAAKKKT